MKNLFVPYELAVKLKEKGFDEPVLCYYNREHNLTSNISPKDWHLNLPYSVSEDCVKAPIYQQIVDWFLDKHNMYLTVTKDRIYKWYATFEKYEQYYEIGNGSDYYACFNKAIENSLKYI
jgi:hypothetical protein